VQRVQRLLFSLDFVEVHIVSAFRNGMVGTQRKSDIYLCVSCGSHSTEFFPLELFLPGKRCTRRCRAYTRPTTYRHKAESDGAVQQDPPRGRGQSPVWEESRHPRSASTLTMFIHDLHIEPRTLHGIFNADHLDDRDQFSHGCSAFTYDPTGAWRTDLTAQTSTGFDAATRRRVGRP
jgi:hypothetical protein